MSPCYYSIEVKSRVTAAEIQDAIKKGKEILNLYYSGKEKQQGNLSPVTLAFFAFDSDLSGSGTTELERYTRYDPHFNDDPILKAICVVGKGYWWHRTEDKAWTFHPPTAEHDEVIDMVSGVTNTLLKQPPARRTLLGYYLMKERNVTNFMHF